MVAELDARRSADNPMPSRRATRQCRIIWGLIRSTQGSDVAKALVQIAHDKKVGSIIIGHSRNRRMREMMRGSIVQDVLRLVTEVDTRRG